MSLRRCHWYDDDGAPRPCRDGTRGCHRGRDCNFVHPTDSEWRKADKVGPPPRHLLADGYDSLSRIFSGPKNTSPPRPSPLRERRSPPPYSTGAFRDTFRGRTPAPPPAPKATPPPPQPPRPRTPSTPANEATRGRVRSGPELSTLSATKPHIPLPSLIRSSPLSHDVTMATQPSSLPTKDKEPSREEKMNTWVDRIKIISDAVLARAEYLRLEKEIQGFQRIVHAWRVVDASEDKTRLVTQLTSLEAQFDLKKKELNSLTHRLIDADFWPAVPQNTAFGMRGTVEDLQDQVKDLHTTIRKMETLHLPSSSTTSASPPKEASPTDEVNRPVKRRRLEDGDLKTASDSSAATQEVVENVALSSDFENLQERVMILESQLSEMQNELIQYDHNMLLSLEDEMEARLEQYGLKPGGGDLPTSTPADPPAPPIPEDPQKMKALENGLQKAGEEITVIAQEVGQLIIRNDARDQDMLLLHSENEQLKAEIDQLRLVQGQTQKTLEAQKAEIDALKAAVSVYISQKKPQPRVMPSLDDIIVSCRPQLIHEMRQEIRPLLEEMKEAVENMLKTQSTELCNVVLSKLATTLSTVETIAKWMDSMKGIRPFNSATGLPPQKLANKSPAG